MAMNRCPYRGSRGVRVHFAQFGGDTSLFECTECGFLYDVLEGVEEYD
jgi:hypothetical protein